MRSLLLINLLLAIVVSIGNSCIPILATQYVGLSVFSFALLEGFAEMCACFIRVLSGHIFDKSENKKGVFVVAGMMSTVAKLLLLAPSFFTVLSAKVLERFSNGFFAAPRDAFGGLASKSVGGGISLLTFFKSAGLIIGSIGTGYFLSFTRGLSESDVIVNLVSIAAIMCLICTILAFNINLNIERVEESENSFNLTDVLDFVRNNFWLLAFCALFFVARFADGLILLFLKDVGFEKFFYTSYIGVFNSVMFIASPIFGYFLDNKKKRLCTYATVLSIIAFNVIALLLDTPNLFFGSLLLAFWGLQRVGAQVVFTSLILDSVPKSKFGVSIGVYSMIIGAAGFLGSSVSGFLQQYSYKHMFCFTLSVSVLSLFLLVKKINVKNT